MSGTRMTKGEFQQAFGALNPVGHAILAFENDAVAAAARKALLEAGIPDADVFDYASSELAPRLDEMMRKASGTSGFGYEITLMRRYATLASQGAGWLVAFAPEEEDTAKVAEVAKRFDARSAVRYGQLLHEDLI